MSELKTHRSSGSTFATILIGLIILAFVFTGYQSFDSGMTGGPGNIGSVAGMSIKLQEYQAEYTRQVDFYKQISGGQELSAKQIENMKVKESAIKNIVQRKLMVKFTKDLGTFPSDEEVKNEIRTLPYFQTNNQFDITRYKGLLAANNITTFEFEEDVVNQLRMKHFQELSANFPLSKGYLADLDKFREQKVGSDIVQISKNSLRQFIDVSPSEISTFLAVDTNQKRIESMFNERKESLGKPAEIKVRHILLTSEGKNDADVKTQIEKIAKEVNAQNFSKLADKYTEDPSGKGKGGDLGTVSPGRMVPEFEAVAFSQKPGTVSAPVKTTFGYHLILVEKKTEAVIPKLESFREKFAKEIIQKDKVEDLKTLTVNIANNLRKAMEAGNDKEVKAIADKYSLQRNIGTINRIDGVSTGAYLSAENTKTIFSQDLTRPQFHSFDDGQSLIMIRTFPAPAVAATEKTDAEEATSLKNALSKKMMDNILKQLEADSKIKINSDAIQM
jgi:peptidyl-prolyl cis-trans isomerase D